ncbi:MAG: lysophospholipid acyltransferase family protein [Paracoccaceae bacterium]
MSMTWEEGPPPPRRKIGLNGWIRVILRGIPVGALVFGGLVILLAVRLIERPVCGQDRPITPRITRFVCRNALRLMGVGLVTHGTPMTQRGAVVANHSSWLDIFALNASDMVYFVSKAEVANWPGIGWLARATGTVFIARDPKEARRQTGLFQNRLFFGHRLLFFPEGTSTDGLRVLPFKSTLFAAFMTPELKDKLALQPTSVIYHAPAGADARYYGWWGDMDFGPHLLNTLAGRYQGTIEVVYHDPIPVADHPDRKSLAAACEANVRQGHTKQLAIPKNPS